MNLDTRRITSLIFWILFGVLLDATSSHIILSQESNVKLLNETFAVICRDSAGRKVEWSGPKGVLGVMTRPKVENKMYGTTLIFYGTKAEDTGTYTCNSGSEKKHYKLVVEERHTSTESINTITYNPNRSHRKPYRQNKHTTYHSTTEGNQIDARIDVANIQKSYNSSENYSKEWENGAPISFPDSPEEQTAREGNDAVVRCEVRGGQATWSTLDDEELAEPKFKVVADGLIIKNVTREDSKTYVCKAFQSSTGNIFDRKIRLIVQHKPVLVPHYATDKIVYGYINGYVNLTCEVYAEPAPRFQWYLVIRKEKKKISGEISASTHASVLQLYVTKRSFGDYVCVAKNNLGMLEKIFTLDEGSQPDPPKGFELVEAFGDTLVLEIIGPDLEEDRDENMDPRWYGVEYKNSQSEEDWSLQEFNITDENTYSLSGLEPLTDYEVRCATKNLAGFSDFTNSSIFKTVSSAQDCTYSILMLLLPLLCQMFTGN
ncbi:unnamed protein product [Brassicogethes aeneus]|uniref:Uncharacterized protein n=1 Tax=Brassicogethes aeneus TaxID=1431903 RepID=A0A9P0BE23_BRAAE|nr:unnamed protein product [Brassicogethes aeneus]